MVTPSPLAACRDLDAAARLVARHLPFAAAMKTLRRTREKDQFYLLSGPATVAMAIDALGLTWPTDRAFRLLLLGAPRDEFLDRGQWYRFVPAMLGHQGKLEVTVCDDNSPRFQSRVPHCLVPNQQIPVKITSSAVAELPESFLATINLAISFSPLPATSEVLADLKALGRHRIPLAFTSWSTTHCYVRHAMFEVLSAPAACLCVESPFALPSKRMGEQRNRALSVVRPESLPSPDATLDQELLELLAVPLHVSLASHHGGTASLPWPIGGRLPDHRFHTLDGIAVHPETLQVFDLSTETLLGTLDDSHREYVQGYSPATSSSVDRFIWAAHVRYLIATAGIAALSEAPRSAA